MKIERVNPTKVPIKNEKFLSNVISTIFAISKHDKNFVRKDDLISVENELKQLQLKISKQDNLLLKSKELTEHIDNKILMLEGNIETTREQLLEKLGSEI